MARVFVLEQPDRIRSRGLLAPDAHASAVEPHWGTGVHGRGF